MGLGDRAGDEEPEPRARPCRAAAHAPELLEDQPLVVCGDPRAAVADVHAQAGQGEVHVVAEVREPLPQVRGDAERLRQVLTNLIDNAIKYSPAGAEVEVRAYQEDGLVRIDVRDSGPGIAKDDQKLIFEKFGRVTGSGATRPGTGLGLFIARSIAEAHGGALDVDSAPDQGSTFTLELPVQS